MKIQQITKNSAYEGMFFAMTFLKLNDILFRSFPNNSMA